MKEELKDKFNTIKTNVKNTWDKVTEDDKSKLKQDIKDRNYSGAINPAKDNFQKNGKV